MKKKQIVCFVLFLFNYSFGQDYNSFFLRGNDPGSPEGTNIVPPTPESFYRTQYGNADINEFKGFPSVSIPLHTLVNGSLKESFTLKYSKPGVKVNDLPNTVGMNWILETGGIITRTIYDLADDFQSQERILLNDSEFAHITSSNGATSLGIYARDMNDVFDNELDIFNYSIPGYNGSFYLNKNLKPELLTQNHDLKIEVVGDFRTTYTFLITTNDGTKYTFGGTDAIETTSVRLDAAHSGVTSFYLKEIEDVSANKINYFYNNVNVKTLSMGEQRVETLIGKRFTYYSPMPDPAPPNPPGGIPSVTTYNNLRVNNAKSISKITTKDEEINFNYVTESEVSPFRKLGNIVISKNGLELKKILFDYKDNGSSTPDTGKTRFFLYAVKEYTLKNNNENFVKEYKFDYDDPWTIPDRLSRTVDYLGYFNGTFNSQTFMPNLNLFGESYVQFQQNTSYADRRPNFNYAKKGTLTSITYPTKGTTFFEYEGAVDQKSTTSKSILGDVINSDYFVGEFVKLLNGNDVLDNLLQINLHIRRFKIEGIVGGPLEAHLKIFDKNTNEILSDTRIVAPRPSMEDIDAGEFNKDINYTFNTEKNRQYKIVLSLEQRSGLYYTADYTINYHEAYVKENGPGVRLKKTYDVDENNNVVNIKRIYYSRLNNINNFDIIQWPYKPNFISYNFDQVTAVTTAPDSCGYCANTLYQTLFHSEIQSSRLDVLEYYEGEAEYFNNIYDPIFPNVTISYGGDHFEKGGEEKTFDTTAYTFENSYLINSPTTDGMEPDSGNGEFLSKLIITAKNSLYRHFPLSNNYGRLISQRIFNNKNGTLFLRKKINNNYASAMGNRVYSITGKKLFPFTIAPAYVDPDTTLINMYAGANAYPAYSSFLLQTKTTEYLDDLPLSIADDSSYNKLTTTTNYIYGNPSHYQLTSQRTTFPDLSYQTTDYSYSAEKGNNYLTGKNMVGIPLVTETKKNGKTISKTETIYPTNVSDAVNTTMGYPLPKSVLSYNVLTGTPESEITYDEYDNRGNLRQYTTKYGIPVAIIWGYDKTQPIAKIVGAKHPSQMSWKTGEVPQSLIDVIVLASDDDADDNVTGNPKEQLLLDALDNFRKDPLMADYQVTTYTYDPLIGVRSITPPNGIRENYIYDTANRLKEVKDIEGNILKEYQYHYKP
jgi:hypothetical protein